MGAARSKPVRTAPVRFVAKRIPRERPGIEKAFAKPNYTTEGINRGSENIGTEPRLYVENELTKDTMPVAEHMPGRYHINSTIEMMESVREDRVIMCGSLPLSWFRDKHEPYSLVRGRIDDQDLDWLLGSEAAKLPMEEIVEKTKLERQAVEDILATVELPRTQYRNYKGKLHKALDNPNEFNSARKKQVTEQRESEFLRRIGYSDEDLVKEEQYRTQRSRGVKTLDELGVSLHAQEKRRKSAEGQEMAELLEERRRTMIEAGEYVPSEEELKIRIRNDVGVRWRQPQVFPKQVYKLDHQRDSKNDARLSWWVEKQRFVTRGTDRFRGVPKYHDDGFSTRDQMFKQMDEAAEIRMSQKAHEDREADARDNRSPSDPSHKFDMVLRMMNSVPKQAPMFEVDEEGMTEEQKLKFEFPHVPKEFRMGGKYRDGLPPEKQWKGSTPPPFEASYKGSRNLEFSGDEIPDPNYPASVEAAMKKGFPAYKMNEKDPPDDPQSQ